MVNAVSKKSGTELRTLSGHSDAVVVVAVTPDGRRAVSASWDRRLKVVAGDTTGLVHFLELME
jgi:WD40 repeat protein